MTWPLFPQVSLDHAAILCAPGGSLLDRLEDLGHIVILVHRVNEHMNMVGHEYVGKDNEVVEFSGFVYSFGYEFANLVILEIWLAVKGRECELMRNARIVPGFSSLVLDWPIAHGLSFTFSF